MDGGKSDGSLGIGGSTKLGGLGSRVSVVDVEASVVVVEDVVGAGGGSVNEGTPAGLLDDGAVD